MTGVGTVVRWRDLNSRNGSGMVASDGDPALPSFGAVKGTTKSSPRVLDRSSRAASRRPFPFTFWCAPPSAPVGLRLCCTTPMWSTRDPRLFFVVVRTWLSSSVASASKTAFNCLSKAAHTVWGIASDGAPDFWFRRKGALSIRSWRSV